jgi:hypothetical protein
MEERERERRRERERETFHSIHFDFEAIQSKRHLLFTVFSVDDQRTVATFSKATRGREKKRERVS